MAAVYVVERQGVYGQGIVGVFTEISLAVDAAVAAIRAEDDAYHDFVVWDFELDEALQLDQPDREPAVHFSCERDGTVTMERHGRVAFGAISELVQILEDLKDRPLRRGSTLAKIWTGP